MIKSSDFGSEAEKIGTGDESDLRRSQNRYMTIRRDPYVEDTWTSDDALRSMLFIRREIVVRISG